MCNYKKETMNISHLTQQLVCLHWFLKSLNDDKDLDKKIRDRFDFFKKGGSSEVEFPEGTVVRFLSFSQELKKPEYKDFFLIKLGNIEMPKAKKRKLLVDYYKQFFNKINDFAMAIINRVVKGKIYCATSKSGEKYYLYAEYNIFSRPYDEEDYFYDDEEFY